LLTHQSENQVKAWSLTTDLRKRGHRLNLHHPFDKSIGPAMCYSAQIEANYKRYIRQFGAGMSIEDFTQLYLGLVDGSSKVRTPKAMDAAFLESSSEDTAGIRDLAEQYSAAKASALEQEIFKQKKRLADAERTLQSKATKAATESKRIAVDKIDSALRRLDDIKRTDLLPRDSRIFPQHYAPVLVVENGLRVVKPMRYGCRIAGKPANYDIKFPGTYNARRDNLERFWKPCFGYTHGIMIVEVFYENVSKAKMEGRELAEGEKDQNVVLEFRPDTGDQMLVACLWSKWTAPGEPDLLSFAAITDEPPAEVAAAGHDRCIIPIKEEHVGAWLNPDPNDLASLYAILEDKERPYYEHRLAA
jgi:putative SOS response-associated peptidase YedK